MRTKYPRERALENFRSGRTRVLIASDIAARGIDAKGISLVVNYDIPNEPESYVHRIDRTARAGEEGLAFAFCDHTERDFIRSIERLIQQTIPVLNDHPYAKAGNSEPSKPKPVMRRDGRLDWVPRKRTPGGRPGSNQDRGRR